MDFLLLRLGVAGVRITSVVANTASSAMVSRVSVALILLDRLGVALEGVVVVVGVVVASLDGVLALPSLLSLTTSLSSEMVSRASTWLFLVERRVGVASGGVGGMLSVLAMPGSSC